MKRFLSFSKEVAKLNAEEWYFFSFRDRKYATGFRTNRATVSGYWKATGKDRMVLDGMTGEMVGMRKTLVFYKNRAPNGIKTGWIMHEFRLETSHRNPQEDWVLCRVFHKSKSDNRHSQHRMMDGSLDLSSSPSNRTLHLPFGYNQMETLSSTGITARQNFNNQCNSVLNLLQFSGETNHEDSTATQISPDNDEYGFLWDMDLEENNLGSKSLAPNMEDNIKYDITYGS